MNNEITGREQNRLKNELKLKQYVSNMPEYISSYLYSLHNVNSYRSKSEYIHAACQYIAFLRKNDCDISNTKCINIDNTNRYFDAISTTTGTNGKIKATSIAYRKQRWSLLNNFFTHLVLSKKIKKNPLDSIKREKGRDNVKRVYMEKSDIQNVIMTINHSKNRFKYRDLSIVCIFLQTGIRVTALTEMNTNNVEFLYSSFDHINENLDGAKIYVIDKGNKADEYYLSKEAALYLKDWISVRNSLVGIEEIALFINNEGTRISTKGVEKMIRKYSPVINGKQITPHKYRATFGTLLYKETKDIHLVQRLMHHESSDTTQIYVVDDDTENIEATKIMANYCFK